MLIATKGNLINCKNTLKLCKSGYELLDKKKLILIQERTKTEDEAKLIEDEISSTFERAYSSLKRANLKYGIAIVEQISYAFPLEKSVNVKWKNVMGVETPELYVEEEVNKPNFGFKTTGAALDETKIEFDKVKRLCVKLAMIESSLFRLNENIKNTEKRANNLKNILIPRFELEVKRIQNEIEEKEREEFSRLKIIKRNKSYKKLKVVENERHEQE